MTMRLVLLLFFAVMLGYTPPASAEASAGSQESGAELNRPSPVVDEDGEQRVRHHGFSREPKRKSTVIKLGSPDKKAKEGEWPVAGDGRSANYGYPTEGTGPVRPEKSAAPGRKTSGDSPAGKEMAPARTKKQPAQPRKEIPIRRPEAEKALGAESAVQPSSPGAGPDNSGKARVRVVRSGSDSRRSTVITLPPKNESRPPRASTKAAPKEPYGYHPEQAEAEKIYGPPIQEKRNYYSGRDKQRRVTTIALPPKGGRAAEDRASVEPRAAEREMAPAVSGRPAKARDKRTSRAWRENRKAERAGRAAARSKTQPPRREVPAKGGSQERNQAGGRNIEEAKAPVPVPVALPAVNSAEAMKRAYQAFDRAYEGSLGKTRKELTDVWGFPMQRMGGEGDEVAYGFRQRGVMAEIPAADSKKKEATHHYTSGDVRPGQSGKNFACLVVLWVDKGGRGVVVDGDAVGDCFLVETLPQKPLHFER